MSRELKFKLLEIATNKFWIDGKGWDMYSLFVSYREQIAQTDKFRLLQYTGLKDTDGKEIYEGDIIKLLYHFEYLGDGKVIWMNCDCFLQIKNPIPYRYLSAFCDEDFCGEIIGNIFENPELIK